jgi:penicillin V acylase-like amidase (Ntn superfamily)
MNDAGLTLSTMALRESVGPAADHRPSLDMMWPQYLLDTCERVDDVIATNVTVRPSTLDHHLVADRFGGVAVIEILDGQMVATTGEDLCAAALTNSVYSYSCDMWELMRDHGDYPDDDNSILRFCRAADLVAAFSGASQGRAIAFALDSLREIYPPLLRGYTRWSIVFDTENLRAYFRTQRNRETRWVDLEAFDLRCGQPIVMLDINAQLSGDVSDAFVPYDSARNREVMLDYYRRWNISYDPISVDWVLDHIESFPCCETRRPSARRAAPSAELRRRIEDRTVIP